MTQPNLLNPISVVIEKLDKTSTQWNKRLRENINIIGKGQTFTIDAQVVYNRSLIGGGSKDSPNYPGDEDNFGLVGKTLEGDGYILVRLKDMNDLGLTVNNGDKITKLGQFVVDYAILGTRPAAHYQDQGGFTLLVIFFEDRNP